MKVKIKDIEANPHRDIKNYTLNESIVDTLKESIEATGFWKNIIARRKPGSKAKVQLVYGHHRLEAAKQLFDKDHSIDLAIEKFDDEQMLAIMARENHKAWTSSPFSDLESVQAALTALAAGKLESAECKQPNKDGWRQAPSAMLKTGEVVDVDHLYSQSSLADFLGLTETRVLQILAILEIGERGIPNMDLPLIISVSSSIEALYTEYKDALNVARQCDGKPKKEAAKIKREAESLAEEIREEAVEQTAKNPRASKKTNGPSLHTVRAAAATVNKRRNPPPPSPKKKAQLRSAGYWLTQTRKYQERVIRKSEDLRVMIENSVRQHNFIEDGKLYNEGIAASAAKRDFENECAEAVASLDALIETCKDAKQDLLGIKSGAVVISYQTTEDIIDAEFEEIREITN